MFSRWEKQSKQYLIIVKKSTCHFWVRNFSLVKCGNIYALSYELKISNATNAWHGLFVRKFLERVGLSRENWVQFTFILSKAELSKSFPTFLARFAGDQRQILSLYQWSLSLKTTWDKQCLKNWNSSMVQKYIHTCVYILIHFKNKENHNKIKLIEKEPLDPAT